MHALGLLGRKAQVGSPHTPLERKTLRLEAVLAVSRRAREGAGGIHVEHEREVGTDAAAPQPVGATHEAVVETAGTGLVGVRGVEVAVAHDDGTATERRLDHLAHELGAAGLVEQQLALVRHLGIGGIQEDCPDLLGDGRATRLAQGNNLVPPGA